MTKKMRGVNDAMCHVDWRHSLVVPKTALLAYTTVTSDRPSHKNVSKRFKMQSNLSHKAPDQ